MALGLQLMWYALDRGRLCSSADALDCNTCALDRTTRELLHPFVYFPPFNHILMLMTCCTLKHQELTKTLEKDMAKSLTNIS